MAHSNFGHGQTGGEPLRMTVPGKRAAFAVCSAAALVFTPALHAVTINYDGTDTSLLAPNPICLSALCRSAR